MNNEKNDLGTVLKNCRQECGLTLDDVANSTRIRKAYLHALEENRFRDLPGDAYISGFLRNYATVLGLQQSAVMEMYRGQVVDGGVFEEILTPAEIRYASLRQRKKSWGILPWLSVVLLVSGAVAVISLNTFLSPPVALPPREPISVIDTLSPSTPAPVEAAPAGEGTVPATMDNSAALGVPAPIPAIPAETERVETQKPVLMPAVGLAETPAKDSENPLVFAFAGNGIVRLEAFGANHLEFSGDNRAPQKYDLTSSAVLSWKIRQSARLSFADSASIKIWIDQRQLNLAGRNEIFLQRSQPVTGE